MADSATEALASFIAAGVFDAADEPDDEFVFGLDRILDGVGVLVSRLRLFEVVAVVEVRDEPGLGRAVSHARIQNR